jgi:hypothetical protein
MNLDEIIHDPEVFVPVMMETIQQILEAMKLPMYGDVEETKDSGKYLVTLCSLPDDPPTKLSKYKMDLITESSDSFLVKAQKEEHDLQLRIADLNQRYQADCGLLKDLRDKTVEAQEQLKLLKRESQILAAKTKVEEQRYIRSNLRQQLDTIAPVLVDDPIAVPQDRHAISAQAENFITIILDPSRAERRMKFKVPSHFQSMVADPADAEALIVAYFRSRNELPIMRYKYKISSAKIIHNQ